ncbi:MAG: response regulator [Deltaproteobacteria bacterium]|nr:response regulator [Deltaproteobacteria bacterium]
MTQRRTPNANDANHEIRKISAALLSNNGYVVSEAKNGQDAIGHLEENIFEIPFTDISLSGEVNGDDVAAEEKRLQSAIVVVYSSATLNFCPPNWEPMTRRKYPFCKNLTEERSGSK